MTLLGHSRALRAALIVGALAVLAVMLLLAGNQLFALQQRLAEAALGVRVLWWGSVAVVLLAAGWALVRLLFPRRRAADAEPAVPEEPALRAELAHWRAEGVDVAAAGAELDELARRREAGTVVVSVHGEISSGKSTLIRALVADAAVRIDVTGGTTREVTRYDWQAPGGDHLVLADVPGFGGVPEDEAMARGEALRAHLVLIVCEGDLTRGEWRELERLRALDKPLVVAVNKSDAYEDAAWRAVSARLAERLGKAVPVVPVVAGGHETVVMRDAAGDERERSRERPPDLRALRRVLQRTLDRRRGGIDARRDRAVFLMTARKLEGAVREHRQDAAAALVERYSRRAMIGAMAAVAPGSDLIIQGALAAGLVRELCALYRVEVRDVAVDRLIAGLNRRGSHATPLLLGVAGNGLKAFPGVGTLTGGLVHAVAYGLLFRSAGGAVADSLEQRGELQADDALARFEETLGEDLGTPARTLARAAVEEAGGRYRHGGR